MVGDDVVDLGDPEAAATHPRFDARVFGARERAALRRSPEPQRLRWMLWAAKEAAYKLAVKLDPRAIFSPVRFEVEFDSGPGSERSGWVRHGARCFRVRVRRAGDALHALAEAGRGDLVFGLERCGAAADPSRAARDLAARQLAGRLGVPFGAVRFSRRGRIPLVRVDERDLRADLSLSHHGRFVAFACRLDGGAA